MAIPFEDKEYLSRKECAIYLSALGYRISFHRLAHMACEGKGPPCHRVRWTKTYYRRVDVKAWLEANTVRIA